MKKLSPRLENILIMFDVLLDVCSIAFLFWHDWRIATAVFILVIGTRLRVYLMHKEHNEEYHSNIKKMTVDELRDLPFASDTAGYTMDLAEDAANAWRDYRTDREPQPDAVSDIRVAFKKGYKEGNMSGYNRAKAEFQKSHLKTN